MAVEGEQREVGAQRRVGRRGGQARAQRFGGGVDRGDPGGAEVQFGGGGDRVVVRVGGLREPVGWVVQGSAGGGGGGLRAVGGEDPGEDVDRGGREQRVAGDHGVRVAVVAGGQVEVVAVPAAGDRDVEQLAVLGAGDDGVADVGGDALGGVHGGGVAERDVLGGVLAGQGDPPAGGQVGDPQRPVHLDGGDPPAVAVLHPVGAADRKAAVVAAGDDQVPGAGPGAVGELHLGTGGAVGGEPVGAGAGVELRDQLAGGGEHHRVPAGGAVRGPRRVGLRGDGARVADVQPAVVEVEADPGRVARAQRERRGGFRGVGEAHHLGQGDRAGGLGDVAEHPAGADRGELRVVTDQPDAAAAVEHEIEDPGEVGGAGHAGLVEEHQRAGADPPYPLRTVAGVQGVQQLGQGVRLPADLLAEHRGRGGGRRQPDDLPAAVPPGTGEDRHRGGLAGPSRSERELYPRAGGGEFTDQLRLPGVELDPVGGGLRQRQIDGQGGDDPAVAAAGRGEDPLLGVEHRRRGVELRAGDLVHRGPSGRRSAAGSSSRSGRPSGTDRAGESAAATTRSTASSTPGRAVPAARTTRSASARTWLSCQVARVARHGAEDLLGGGGHVRRSPPGPTGGGSARRAAHRAASG